MDAKIKMDLAIAAHGKKKERLTKAINLLKQTAMAAPP